ncbi:MAG: TetR/AcrR family transcriptional regulator [Candidatus Sericytochromatia bacterium]
MQALDTQDLLYRKNPQSTRLGRSILEKGTVLLAQHGLEWLTFRKLAQEMESTEASVYRYFHNKYQLLAYLVHQYGQRLLQQMRSTPPCHLDPVPDLLKQIFPDAENRDPARQLLPIFWGWYAAHEDGEHAYATLALAPFEEIVSHVSQHLGILGAELSTRELAYLLCGSSLLAFMPGFSHQAQVYRQLWDHLLAGLVRAPLSPVPLPSPVRAVEEVSEQEPELEYGEEEHAEESTLSVQTAANNDALLPTEEAAGLLPAPHITHIMVRKFGGYNLLERSAFEHMPLAERLYLWKKQRLQFLSDQGESLEERRFPEVIQQLFKS